MSTPKEVKCPGCGSTQVVVKKRFSVIRSFLDGLLTGSIGMAGAMRSNKTVITCLSCGHKFASSDH